MKDQTLLLDPETTSMFDLSELPKTAIPRIVYRYVKAAAPIYAINDWDVTLTTDTPIHFDPGDALGERGLGGINDFGVITRLDVHTLNSTTSVLTWRKFSIPIQYPQATVTAAVAINDLGQVVGTRRHTPTEDFERGFLWQNGNFTDLPFPTVPGSARIEPRSINNRGEIVGYYWGTSDLPHGFLLVNGQFTFFDYPGTTWGTTFRGINDRGQIVGCVLACFGATPVGFVHFNGAYKTIAVPGATETVPLAINNAGVIAGAYKDATGLHGFKATPTPMLFPIHP